MMWYKYFKLNKIPVYLMMEHDFICVMGENGCIILSSIE